MPVGIEALSAYGGQTAVDVRTLFRERGLNLQRFDNLMMDCKAVALPCEDPVTHAVNAAKPIIDALTPEERGRIEMVITATESGLDFGKSLATYVHHWLELPRNCRAFEIKQACYGGTAGLQMAASWVAAQVSPGAKALVLATDVAGAAMRGTYAEPAQGTGAIAMLVGDRPSILELDLGANGTYTYEVMDTCRPLVGIETGDSDLSLMSYMDCLEGAWADYARRVEGADYVDTFRYLAFHTPFAGMVKGAHRKLLRKLKQSSPDEIEADFESRVTPSLKFCTRIGNIYSATVYLALCGVVANTPNDRRTRVGLFSYGSGCASEFFSGIVPPGAREKLAQIGIAAELDRRRMLTFEEYERMLELSAPWGFGAHDRQVDLAAFADIYGAQLEGRGKLVLRGVGADFHREYGWS